MVARLRTPIFILLLATVSGCLPSSCSRTENRSLMPADSTSREMAASLPVDTLRFVHSLFPAKDVEVEYPRTVRFGPSGRIWMSDTGTHSVYVGGDSLRPAAVFEGEFPYLAGSRGDSLAVFSPVNHWIRMIPFGAMGGAADAAGKSSPNVPESVTRVVMLNSRVPERDRFSWAVVSDRLTAVKVIADGFDGYLALLDSGGSVRDSVALAGPFWRYTGGLIAASDSVISLSGYLPVVDVWHASALDSLRLTGFDSPMLARSRSFQLGDTNEPPLLTASAAVVDSLLFILNMRPGWLRVDVYGMDGRIRSVLTQPDPAFNQEFLPTDLAVRALSDGWFELAVAVAKESPRVDVYHWRPGEAVPGIRTPN